MDAAPLNPQQTLAADFGDGPLLIVAGAGTGKTNTLAHRVARLIARGVDPGRILLLTFTRRAAAEMIRRVERILAGPEAAPIRTPLARVWSGTFHAMANRILRMYAAPLGLGESFTVLDRADSEDLMNSLRGELELDKSAARFPKKGTCLSIYSRCVNAAETIEQALRLFPWCAAFSEQLRTLFRLYTARKQQLNILDYDDLLLYWRHAMDDDTLAAELAGRFDHVLVDEYQDTNALQAGILQRLRPGGKGLTVVGDDAQSIYSFRAAIVENILEFQAQYPAATIVKLEQNYRSTQPILDAANDVIALAPKRHPKNLFTTRQSRELPRLVSLMDEDQQSRYVVQRILEHHEAGIPLKKQAVLFRTSHHSDALEVELTRRNIPFVKYGGLKFLEAAHVKDLLCILRLAENPRDAVSALRVLLLIDGIGPAFARRAIDHLGANNWNPACWESFPAPAAAEQWPAFVQLLGHLRNPAVPLGEQIAAASRFYAPILHKHYDHAHLRIRDLEQLAQLSGNFADRPAMLAELALDPPHSTQDLAGPPLREEDYLILSTIHSAKGCEWDCVYVIHAADGNIPSDMSTGSDSEIEEERRLFYVALTRARDFLEVCVPLRYYHKKHATGDRHTYAQVTRFLPDSVLPRFARVSPFSTAPGDGPVNGKPVADIRAKITAMWA